MNYEFHRLATTDFRDAVRWYRRRNQAASQRFIYAVDDAINRMMAAPDAHPVERASYRWVRVRGFPYRVIFELIEDQIRVIAVAHTSRRPGYWTRRR